MGSRTHGNIVAGDIYAHRLALHIDIGEMALRLLGILVRDIETYMVETVDLHLLVDGTCHNVSGRKR